MLLTILIIIAITVLMLTVFIIAASSRTGVVPMPSLPSERRKVSDILRDFPDIHKATDLGSGWGGLAHTLVRRLPGITVSAVERSAVPHVFSKLVFTVIAKCRISCIYADIFEMKLNNNEAYITYLSGPVMKKLRASFERDQPRGGVLISIAFAMPGWTATRVEYSRGLIHSTVYIYEL